MTTPPPVLCSQAARDAGDDPAGSAAAFSSFLLLHHRGSWSATAADDAVGALGPQDAATVTTSPGLRAFAIRDVHPRRMSDPVVGYAGVNGPGGYLRTLTATDSATGSATGSVTGSVTDGIFAGGEAASPPGRGSALPGPIFAVCTNGRRDRCCAIVGRGVAVRLHAEFGDRVIEISHLGGHRYAGTMLVLPWGYAYGFLDLPGAAAVARAAVQGLVHPDGLRGRADLGPVAQAADVLIRRTLGPAAPDAVVIQDVNTTDQAATVRVEVFGRSGSVALRRVGGAPVTDTLCGGKPFDTGRWVLQDT